SAADGRAEAEGLCSFGPSSRRGRPLRIRRARLRRVWTGLASEWAESLNNTSKAGTNLIILLEKSAQTGNRRGLGWIWIVSPEKRDPRAGVDSYKDEARSR